MKLVAQRVLQPATQAQALHTFHYVHGNYIWAGDPPPGFGTLQASHVVLLPLGGNSVLTYLDVTAPDETPTHQLIAAFAQILAYHQPPPFKLQAQAGITFESNMVHVFQLAWRQELVLLFDSAVATRITIM